ncbi:hypothetical protein ACOJBO_37090 [Rhizobium beringeri]
MRPDGRDLDPEKVWSLPEDDAYGLFDFRWADNNGKPYCPRCGCLNLTASVDVVSDARSLNAALSSR